MPPIKRKAPVKSRSTNKKGTSPKRTAKKSKPMSKDMKYLIIALLLVLFSPFYYGYIIKGFSSSWSWIRDIGEDPNYRTYQSFDIKIPRNYEIHGIDVSYYQGKIDWEQVKAMEDDEVRIRFAFIKATEGLFKVDPYFRRNWREAPKAGIICGAYHYFKPKKSGAWQAKFFLQNVSFERGDLPPVVDVEELNGVTPETMRTHLQEFLNYVEKQTKVRPIIYTGLSFHKDFLSGHFDTYPLWIAHYYRPRLDVEKERWKFWQHSDKARVSGIGHVVDFNVFNGDSLAFSRMLIQ